MIWVCGQSWSETIACWVARVVFDNESHLWFSWDWFFVNCGITTRSSVSPRVALLPSASCTWCEFTFWTRPLTNITHPVTLTLSHYSANPSMLSLCGRRFSVFGAAGNIPGILPQPWIPDLLSPLAVSFHSGWHRVWSPHTSYLSPPCRDESTRVNMWTGLNLSNESAGCIDRGPSPSLITEGGYGAKVCAPTSITSRVGSLFRCIIGWMEDSGVQANLWNYRRFLSSHSVLDSDWKQETRLTWVLRLTMVD